MPRIYLTPDSQPNAFATIAVTEGILNVLDEDGLRSVLAHELSPVRNHDILIGSVAAALAMGIPSRSSSPTASAALPEAHCEETPEER